MRNTICLLLYTTSCVYTWGHFKSWMLTRSSFVQMELVFWLYAVAVATIWASNLGVYMNMLYTLMHMLLPCLTALYWLLSSVVWGTRGQTAMCQKNWGEHAILNRGAFFKESKIEHFDSFSSIESGLSTTTIILVLVSLTIYTIFTNHAFYYG